MKVKESESMITALTHNIACMLIKTLTICSIWVIYCTLQLTRSMDQPTLLILKSGRFKKRNFQSLGCCIKFLVLLFYCFLKSHNFSIFNCDCLANLLCRECLPYAIKQVFNVFTVAWNEQLTRTLKEYIMITPINPVQ